MSQPYAARASQLLCRQCRAAGSRAAPRISRSFAAAAFVIAPSTAPSNFNTSSLRQPASTRSFSASASRSENNNTSSSGAKIPETHYDIFPETLPLGPPPSGHFPIDLRRLRREFLTLQSKHHPDLFPPAQKSRAEASSALINEAYKTLSNPLLRAQYLLSLRGVDVANDETLKTEDPSLLGVVLEAREEIEEAESEEELEGQRDENNERIRGSEEVLEKAFREDDIEMAKREAVNLRYWVNIKDSLDNWEKGKPIVLQH